LAFLLIKEIQPFYQIEVLSQTFKQNTFFVRFISRSFLSNFRTNY